MVAAVALSVVLATRSVVTVTIPGLPVRAAVAKIAEITGEDLRVRDDANVNTLVIQTNGVELDALLKKIEEVTGSEWQKSGDRRTLVTNDDTNSKLRQKESAWRKSAIKKSIAALPRGEGMDERTIEALVARAESMGRDLEVWIPTEEQRAVLQALQAQKPITRLINRLVSQLDIDVLARVAIGNPVVFSDKPAGKELRTPSSARTPFDEYKREFAVWQEAVLRSVAAFPVKNAEDPRFGVKASRAPTTVHVSVDYLAERPYIRLIVRTADDAGEIVDVGFTLLRLEQTGTPLVLQPDLTFDVPIELREMRAHMTFQDTIAVGTVARTLAPQLPERLCAPASIDPVSLGLGQLMMSIAKASGRNLVACVSDVALDWYYRVGAIQQQWRVNSALAEVDVFWGLDVTDSDGWLLAMPKLPVQARDKYYDRKALQVLFEAQHTERFIPIESARRYAADQSSTLAFRGYDSRVVLLGQHYSGNIADGHLIHWESEKALRAISAMNEDEVSRARSATGVLATSLGAKARECLAKWLNDPSAVFQGFRRSGQTDYSITQLSQLPSRLLGLQQLRVRIVESTEPMTFQQRPGNWKGKPFADYFEYSGNIYQESVEATPNIRVQIGTLRKLEVRLELPDGSFVSVEVDQAAALPTDKWVRPSELPSDALAMLKAAYERSLGGLTQPSLGRATRTS